MHTHTHMLTDQQLLAEGQILLQCLSLLQIPSLCSDPASNRHSLDRTETITPNLDRTVVKHASKLTPRGTRETPPLRRPSQAQHNPSNRNNSPR